MEIKEYPFYGLGIIAFCVAESDGEIQQRESRELKEIIHQWNESINTDFDVTEIIFSILAKTKGNDELSYEKGMKYISTGKEEMTESLKEKFILLINDIAHAFPPVTESELAILNRFRTDLKHL
ncbi:MAG: hypothetical protein WEC59_11080 [Salibacteraceae bacterium]